MNCPSRTDEVEWTPGWNQSPAWLAADLTTRQDLNGLINARELKRDRRAGSPKDESLDDDYRLSLAKGELQRGPRSSFSAFWSWTLWLLSVFCTALLISNIDILRFSNMHFPSFSRASATSTNGELADSDTVNCTCWLTVLQTTYSLACNSPNGPPAPLAALARTNMIPHCMSAPCLLSCLSLLLAAPFPCLFCASRVCAFRLRGSSPSATLALAS